MIGYLGNDKLRGGTGRDRIFGEEGNDLIAGNDDNDFLFGEEGLDTISGGGGRDRIRGGKGRDVLKGGADKDTFIFENRSEFGDTISDFKPSEGDVLEFDSSGIRVPRANSSLSRFDFRGDKLFFDDIRVATFTNDVKVNPFTDIQLAR